MPDPTASALNRQIPKKRYVFGNYFEFLKYLKLRWIKGGLDNSDHHAPQVQELSYNAKVGDSLTVDVLNGPSSPADADGAGITYLAATAGIHQFDYTVSDPYGGTATNPITIHAEALDILGMNTQAVFPSAVSCAQHSPK